MFLYNGLMTYTADRKQLLDNKHLQWDWKLHYIFQCYINGDASYKSHILMSQYKHLILLWCWNILNCNLEVQLLARSELTGPWNYAFNIILSMPRSTKYSPFFCLQLQFFMPLLLLLQCHHLINAETFGWDMKQMNFVILTTFPSIHVH